MRSTRTPNRRFTRVFVALVIALTSCRTEELGLYNAYRSGQLGTATTRLEGYYYSHEPSCGASRQANEIVFFYQDGSLLHETWPLDTDLTHFEATLRNSRQYVVDSGYDRGFGWGLGDWKQSTVFAEQFTHATKGRMRVQRWVATVDNDEMTILSYSTPGYGTVQCSTKFKFRPCTWKPDPDAFFKRDKQFIRSQEYFIRRDQRKQR